jgi:hypothetical protein
MLYLYALIGVIVAAGISFGLTKVGIKLLSKSKGSARVEKTAQVIEITKTLESLEQYIDGYASSAQLNTIELQFAELKEAFEAQRKLLTDTEASLANAQKSVETKEIQQQEQKSLKEDDEKKLTDLLAKYESLADESVALEQELANAMKNLEDILATATLTDVERDLLTQFNDAVIAASSRLRDLMTEYNVVKERLETIQGQFKDLEDEYTRLVEQQLGI